MTSPSTPHSEIPDIRGIGQSLWRNRYLMAGIWLAIVLVGAALIFMQPRQYTASTAVMIEEQDVDLADFREVLSNVKFDELTVETQVNIMNSPSLAMKTIEATGLADHPQFRVEDSSSASDPRLVKAFLERLEVAPLGESRIIQIAFTAEDPQLAARVANTHTEMYLATVVDAKRQQADRITAWMQREIAQLKADAEDKARQVQRFRATEGLVLGRDSTELVYQQISDTAAQLVPIEARKLDLQARLQAISAARGSGNGGAITEVVDSRLVQDLKAQESLAAQRLSAVSSDFGPNHPLYASANGEVSQARSAVYREISTIEQALRNEAATAARQEAALKSRLDLLRQQGDAMRGKLVTLRQLEQEETASLELLENFLGRYQELRSQAGITRPDAHVVSGAVTPGEPSAPNRMLLLVAVAALATLLAISIALIHDMMGGGLRNFDDIESLGLTPLGVLPDGTDPVAAVLSDRNTTYKEAIKRIYMSSLLEQRSRSLLITAALPGEGKSSFALAMAYYLLSIGRRVVVLDTDFHNPTLAGDAMVESRPGLSDYLAGRTGDELPLQVNKLGLAVLPAGSRESYSPSMLTSARFGELMRQLREHYDYILVDSSPVLARAEAGLLANRLDSVLLLTHWRKTSRRNLERAIASLQRASANIAGVVLNKVDIEQYRSLNADTDFVLPRHDAFTTQAG